MTEHNEGSSFLGGLVIGSVLGAALGLVLSGDDTRKKILSKIEGFDFEKAIDKLAKAFDEGVKEASNVSRKVNEEEEL